ncbi:MAG: hypothetical protein JWM87_257 [Candidatus Eremiobacteraeota bacterium]|nr:hypothetical protein [Candidatus Eremiobacteraeota bacterium]
MMQTQWPGLGPNLDFTSLDASAGTGRQMWAGDGAFRTTPPSQPADAIVRPWWQCGTGTVNGGDPFGGLFGGSAGSYGGMTGLVSGLVSVLQQLIGALLNQSTNPNQSANTGQSTNANQFPGQTPLPGGPQQRFENVDISSTGDPHIAETGTREGPGGTKPVDVRWDSMTSHDDLVHSNQIEGGYRVSTAVTQPGANGVTFNQSATVHANFDQDAITMNRDGSFAIFDDGEQVELGKGESATLSGGEKVSVNQDGSLVVNAKNAAGGSIATTLRSIGAGVDVSTHAHEIALGGDAITHGAHAHRGHKHHHDPVRQRAGTPATPATAPAPPAQL